MIEVVSLNMITTSNLFLMNNVSFIFRTSKHNTGCFLFVFAQEKSIMITSLEDNVCLCNHQIFFTGIDQFGRPS